MKKRTAFPPSGRGKNIITCACRAAKTKKKTERDQTNRNQSQPYQRTTMATKKKKKQERERNLGEDVEQDVRVELVVRGHVGETQGESQTPKGVWVSPAPEREKKRKNGADEHTEHKKKRGQPTSEHTGVRS